MNLLAVVLHDRVPAGAPPDQLDTLEQMRVVTQALEHLGYRAQQLALDLNLNAALQRLRELAPAVVFNLAESVGGDGRLVQLPAQLLEGLALPYTGCSSEALYLTTNKPLGKHLLRGAGLPTPDWHIGETRTDIGFDDPGPWLVKSVNEEASIGMDADALVSGQAMLHRRLAESAQLHGGAWFAERYVEGREFNVSLLDGNDGPTVLPIAEMCFLDYPPGVPRIVDYAAKWDTGSFGYRHTRRTFVQQSTDAGLCESLARLARECWALFGLRGYARVDFRVDDNGQPWILEVNANPCIAPDAGFVAAAARAGFDLPAVVKRLLDTAAVCPRN